MKFLNKILLIALVFSIASCDMTDLDLTENPNAVTPENASVNEIFNKIQVDLSEMFQATWNFAGGLSRQRTSTGGFTYNDVYSPVQFNFIWAEAYARIFPDVDALVGQAEEKGLDIHAGAAKIMKAYAMVALVDVFGDVPFSQAGQGTDEINPAADSGADVYAAAHALLAEAVTQLTGTSAAAPANDVYFGGDASKWIKAANTIRMKMALNTGDGAAIKDMVGAGIIESNGDDFQFQYSNNRANPDSRHWFYPDTYEASDGTYMANYYMWLLNGEKLDENENPIQDPRARFYFYRQVSDSYAQDVNVYSCIFSDEPDFAQRPQHFIDVDPRLPYCVLDNGYYGRDHMNGSGIPPDGPIRTAYGLYPAGGKFDDNSFSGVQNQGIDGGLGAGIAPMVLASFADLMRAEAALTLNTGEDARALLESGIQKSMDKVFGFRSVAPGDFARTFVDPVTGETVSVEDVYATPAENRVPDYIAHVLSTYDNADDDGKLEVIVKELFIAAWGNGLETYNAYRRTCKPARMQPTIEPQSGNFIRSAWYPSDYVDLNASASQKSDVAQPVFWDTNDGSCNY
jgi:hypothetical protein